MKKNKIKIIIIDGMYLSFLAQTDQGRTMSIKLENVAYLERKNEVQAVRFNTLMNTKTILNPVKPRFKTLKTYFSQQHIPSACKM